MKKDITFTFLKLVIGAFLYGITFFLPKGLFYFIILGLSYFILTYQLVIDWVKDSLHTFFDERFLMLIATIGAFLIQEYPEAVAVMLFYQIGEFLSEKASLNTKEAVTKLMDFRVDIARVLQDGMIRNQKTETVPIDAILRIQPGEKVPLDGVVIKGESYLDYSSMTGESVPQFVTVGDTIMSGSINQNGVLEIKVTSELKDSTVTKILKLIEHAGENKTKQEKWITHFAKIYTPIIVVSAILLFLFPLIFLQQSVSISLSRALVFLVISCPCALVVSVPLGFFCGIGKCSKKGILVKSSNVLENIDTISTILFDKTGTLTKGIFQIEKVMPLYCSKEELIEIAAIAESGSNHPIARSIQEHYAKAIPSSKIQNYEEIAGKGVRLNYEQREIVAGNESFFEELGIVFPKTEWFGTVLLLAVDREYMGSIMINDVLKENANETLHTLKQLGIEKMVMLSGDHKLAVEQIGKKLPLDACYASLLPADKVALVDSYQQEGKVLFVGDGTNDAPVIMHADIGASMGGIGSDAAISASDMVFMHDDLMQIVETIRISKKTKRIVKINIIFALMMKAIILLLGFFGIANMWLAVFSDVGVTLLTILNSLRILK